MNVKWIFGALAGAIALAMLWRVGQSALSPMLGSSAPPPKAIVFDNGTVRDTSPASGAASAVVQQLPLKGGMRKCVRRSEVIYTDRPCPHGMSEQTIDKSRFNLVDGQPR